MSILSGGLHERLLDAAPEAIIVAGPTGKLTFANRQAQKMFGYTAGQLDGMPLDRLLVHADNGDGAGILHGLSPGDVREIQVDGVGKDGGRFPAEVRVALVEDEGAQVATAAIRDASSRHEQEAALRKREHQLDEAQAVAHVGSWEWDIPADTVTWTRELYRLYGLDPAQGPLDFEGYLGLLHPDDRELAAGVVQDCMQTGQPYDFAHRLVRPDGEVRWLRGRGRLERDAEGNPMRMTGTAQDITEQQAQEEALLKREMQLNEAQAVAKVGSWEWDVAADKVTWTQEMYRLFARDPKQGPLDYEGYLGLLHPDDRETAAETIAACMKTGDPYDFEHRVPQPDGSTRWIRSQGRLVRDEEGNPSRLLGTAQDITEQKEDQDRIQAALAEKEVLLKEIHHRVKNNLQVVSSLLNLQISTEEDEGVIDVLQESRLRVLSMALVHERLYRSEDLAVLDLGAYAEDLISELRRAYHLDPPTRLRLEADELQIDLDAGINCGLLINELVSNAFKHAFDGDEGQVVVRLEDRGEDTAIVVEDDGRGVPDDFRSRNTLGTRLIDTLVKQLGGTMETSNPDGARFEIVFSRAVTHA